MTCTPWATAADVTGDYDDSTIEQCLVMASNMLYRMSGHHWPGSCSGSYRPCDMDRGCGCTGRTVCGCTVDEVQLPDYPVKSIERVLIDGVELAEERYQLSGWQWLVFMPDESDPSARRAWPRRQRLDRPTTAEGTWVVEYTWGADPPPEGKYAASVLAQQLSLARKPKGSGCRLPQRVQTVARQGVTIAILDRMETLLSGQGTGLAEVDMWLGSLRAGRRERGMAVVVPELVVGRRGGRRVR